MMTKRSIARRVCDLQYEMRELESKRSRSMAVILEALVRKTEPNAVELMYFRTYSAKIDEKREQMQALLRQLEK